MVIASSPKNPFLDKIVSSAARSLGRDLRFESYNDSSILNNVLVSNNYLAGIEFDDDLRNVTEVPDNLNFSIRFPSEMRTISEPGSEFWATWWTILLFPNYQYAGARWINRSDGGYPVNYFAEGFVAVQSAVSQSIIKMRNGNSTDVYLSVSNIDLIFFSVY